MGKEDFDAVFDAVEEVFGLGGIFDMLVLDQHGLLVPNVDDLAEVAEVQQDIVNAADGVVAGNGSHKQNLRGVVLQKILLQVRVHRNYGFALGPHGFNRHHLPVVLAFQGQLSELGVHVAPIVPTFLTLSYLRRGVRAVPTE